ncbi:hypothetical protein C8259_28285 [Nocardia nova]|uniref:Uncharacterized protein n=1 Tax=Nocardia nova TaxID=37330 RepID=A0A2T2YU87_9NOCA|nr:hypothetical protein C8259_28285 [Nocardia nova]
MVEGDDRRVNKQLINYLLHRGRSAQYYSGGIPLLTRFLAAWIREREKVKDEIAVMVEGYGCQIS